MVRISDLVRGKATAPETGGDMHALRLKNVTEMARLRGSDPAVERLEPAVKPEPPQTSPASEAPSIQGNVEVAVPPVETSPSSPAQGELWKGVDESKGTGKGRLDPFVTPLAREIYEEARRYLLGVKEDLPRRGKLADVDRAVRIVERIVAEPALIEAMYPLTMESRDDADLNTTSSVNGMVYCLKIGVRMGYPPPRLTTLALAALHHDIGMFLIPEGILNRSTRLTPAEIAEVRRHTLIARDLLRPFAGLYPGLDAAVYQHHERESGQGYPEGLRGEAICEEAKIIGICDSYEAMTHNRPHKRSIDQHVSVQELIETKSVFFSARILKAFLDEFTLYPVGSYVRLNNRAIGVVVATNPKSPFKPLLRIAVDGQGHRVTETVFCDLAENNILNIAGGASADDLPA